MSRMTDLMVARDGGVCQIDGIETVIQPGEIAHRRHPAVSDHPELWGPLVVKYAVADDDEDDAPAAHVSPPRSPARADQRGARSR